MHGPNRAAIENDAKRFGRENTPLAELEELHPANHAHWFHFNLIASQHKADLNGNFETLGEQEIHYFLRNQGHQPKDPGFSLYANRLRIASQTYVAAVNAQRQAKAKKS